MLFIREQNYYQTAPYFNNLKKMVMQDTTEEFRPLPGNEEYLVSNRGRVYSRKTGCLMNEFPSQHGYMQVNINRLPTKIHQLVAKTFLPNPNDPKMTDINHIDGHKYNNDARNLEYCTRSYNIKHAYDHGLEGPKTGENNGRATMTAKEVETICKKLQEGKSFYQISEEMGWTYNKTIKYRLSKIKTRQTWTNISKNYFF